jgi:hypothetical protein
MASRGLRPGGKALGKGIGILNDDASGYLIGWIYA